MDYKDNKVDKALNVLGMYSCFEDIKKNLNLSDKEFNELKERAKRRYGEEVFSN